MAARQSTSRRPPVRNRPRRPSTTPAKAASRAARPKGSRSTPSDATEPLREFLRDHTRRLNHIMSVVIVAVDALKGQNCDSDAHVAGILQLYAGNKLDIEIEAAQKVLARLDRAARSASL